MGKTYSDGSAQITEWSATAVIATVVGGRLPTDECIVTRWKDDQSRSIVSRNCNAGVASATAPGNSVASPEGRAAKHDKDMEYWRSSTPDGQAWCTENQKKTLNGRRWVCSRDATTTTECRPIDKRWCR
jgi:hypothetical protein